MNLNILLQSIEYHLTKLSMVLFAAMPFLFLFALILLRRVWLQKKNLQLLRMVHENEVLKARVGTQEQTFRNISNDIHNNIGQRLTLINRLTERIKDRGIDTSDITVMLRDVMADLRHLSHSLGTDILERLGLAAAIQHDINFLNKDNTIKAEFYHPQNNLPVDIDTAILLYRVFQEVIQNVLKHAKADKVSTMIALSDDRLCMTIADDGSGFAPDAAEGHGLSNMRARLKLINGSLRIDKEPGGTALYIIIPLNK